MPDAIEDALPGLETAIEPLAARPGDIDMTDASRYTATVLFNKHRRVFDAVCKALFNGGLSDRMTASILSVSVNTVRAIRDMVLASIKETNASPAAARAFFYKTKSRHAKRVIQLKALEEVSDRMENPDYLKSLSISELLSISDRVDTLNEDSSEAKESKSSKDIVVEITEFEDVVNGLTSEKKSAGEEPGENETTACESEKSNEESKPTDNEETPHKLIFSEWFFRVRDKFYQKVDTPSIAKIKFFYLFFY